MTRRAHLVGASGSGAATLGRALAARLDVPHFDTDTYSRSEHRWACPGTKLEARRSVTGYRLTSIRLGGLPRRALVAIALDQTKLEGHDERNAVERAKDRTDGAG
jgi:cytidylate kinase